MGPFLLVLRHNRGLSRWKVPSLDFECPTVSPLDRPIQLRRRNRYIYSNLRIRLQNRAQVSKASSGFSYSPKFLVCSHRKQRRKHPRGVATTPPHRRNTVFLNVFNDPCVCTFSLGFQSLMVSSQLAVKNTSFLVGFQEIV